MQVSHESKTSPRKKPITVALGKGKGLKQPDNFRFCPLGLQFYSRRNVPEFELLEFQLDDPGKGEKKGEKFTCTGVVVKCMPAVEDPSLFRVWVKFLDVPESRVKKIQCVAKECNLLCPYCENFS